MARKSTADIQGTTDRRIDALLTLLAENSTIVISGAKIAAGNRRYAAAGVALDREAARAGRAGERPSAYRLPHRAHAGHSGAADAEPSAVRHAVRAAHPSFFQNRLHEHCCDAPCRTGRAARRRRACRGADGRPRARGPLVGLGEIGGNLLHASAAARHSARARAAADAGGGTCRARRGGRRTRQRSRHSLAERSSGGRAEIRGHPDGDARRARPHSLRRRGHRHQREPVEDARRSSRRSPPRSGSRRRRRIRASSCWSGCCATSTATTINSSPRARQPIVRRFAEVSSYFRGKRVRITTSTESFTGTTAGLEPSGVLRVARDDKQSTELVLSGDVAEAD